MFGHYPYGMGYGIGNGEVNPLAQHLIINPAILAAITRPPSAAPGTTAPAPGVAPAPQGWWASQSSTTKIAIGVGAAAVLAVGAYALLGGKPKAATPNRRRKRTEEEEALYQRRVRMARRALRTRKKVQANKKRKSTVKTCRTAPPKGYPKKRSAYALPECFMYPVNTKARTRTAASRFGKHKRRYSQTVRAKIAKRLDRAKRRFHVGEYHR